MQRFALALVLAGCVSYTPGSYRDPLGRAFHGLHYAVGCIDLALAQIYDLAARGPVIEYSFGNRCVHAATVDLASLDVVADDKRLPVFDPRGELRALPLDGRWSGREQIEYDAPLATHDIFVDISTITGDRANRPPQWVRVPIGAP